jgi:SAM-dependent methyltransferase
MTHAARRNKPKVVPAVGAAQRPGVSEDYSGVGNLEAMEAAVRYRRFLTELLTEAAGQPTPGHKVIDFGAGVGSYAQQARALGWEVTCAELDPALRNGLREQGFGVTASLDAIPPRSVDFLYSYNVLEHIDDDAAVIREFYRVLRPGAPLLVYVPAFQVLYSSMDRLVGHVRRYRKQGLLELAESAGFVAQSCRYADSVGFAASLAYRAIGGSGNLNARSVLLYDRFLFPASRGLDAVAGRFFGKNLVLIARRGLGSA